MRIISGTRARKTIVPPGNFRARPTTDFAKENLFNILSNNFDFEGLKVLDLFSGTGSISYEFCSRGAEKVVSVEINPNHHRFIRQTAEQLSFDALQAVLTNTFVYLRSSQTEVFDIVFADPPYQLPEIDTIADRVYESGKLAEDGWLIIEHSSETDFSGHPMFKQKRTYGSVNFSFFHK